MSDEEEKPIDITIRGTITTLLPCELIPTKKGEFRKRLFTVETGGQYSKMVAFECFNTKALDQLERIKAGTKVQIRADVRCNEHNGKFYTTLNAFSVYAPSSNKGSSKGGRPSPKTEHPKPEESVPEDEDPFGDDVPFNDRQQ